MLDFGNFYGSSSLGSKESSICYYFFYIWNITWRIRLCFNTSKNNAKKNST